MLAALLLVAFADPKTVFLEAERALRASELIKAERGFREFIKLQPGHAGALGNLGVVYSRMGRWQDAIMAYDQALKSAPKSPDLNVNLGLAWLKQDDHKAARTCFERANTLRPGHAQTRELLATTQLFTGDVDSAVTTLESLPPTAGVRYLLSIGYLKQNRRERARDAVSQLFGELSRAQAHLLAGRAYYESTLFEEALYELEKARDLNPATPGLWRELGKTYVSLRRSEEARQALRESLKREPADAEAQYFLGALLVQEGAVKEGVPLLERSRDARPAFWGAWYYLGKAALSGTQARRAVTLLQRALELRPDEPSVLYQLARALKADGRDTEAKQTSARLTALRAKERAEAEEALVVR